jgi:hypothetical protein
MAVDEFGGTIQGQVDEFGGTVVAEPQAVSSQVDEFGGTIVTGQYEVDEFGGRIAQGLSTDEFGGTIEPQGSVLKQIADIPRAIGIGAKETYYGQGIGLDVIQSNIESKVSDFFAKRRDKKIEEGASEDSLGVQFNDLMSRGYKVMARKDLNFAQKQMAAREEFQQKNDDLTRGIVTDVAKGVGGMWDIIPSAMSKGLYSALSSPTRMFDEGYSQAIASGQTPEQATKTATAYIAGASPIEIAADMFLFKGKGKALQRGAIPFLKEGAKKSGFNFLSEVSTEVLQDAWLNKLTGNRMFTPDSLYTFVVSGLVGAIAGTGFGAMNQSAVQRRVDSLERAGMTREDAMEAVNLAINGQEKESIELITSRQIDILELTQEAANLKEDDAPLPEKDVSTIDTLAGKDRLTGEEQMRLSGLISELQEDEQNIILDRADSTESSVEYDSLIARLNQRLEQSKKKVKCANRSVHQKPSKPMVYKSQVQQKKV